MSDTELVYPIHLFPVKTEYQYTAKDLPAVLSMSEQVSLSHVE